MPIPYSYFLSEVGIPVLGGLIAVGALTGLCFSGSSRTSTRLISLAAVPSLVGLVYAIVLWSVGYTPGSVLTHFIGGFLMSLPAVAAGAACASAVGLLTRSRYWGVGASIAGAILIGPVVVAVGIVVACSFGDCI